MIALLLLAGLTSAAPVSAAPELPLSPQFKAHASALGGVDAWTGAGGYAGELDLGVWGQRQDGSWELSGGYSGMAEILGALEGGVLDQHLLAARAQRRTPLHPGVGLSVRSGLLYDPAWVEGEAQGSLGGALSRRSWLLGSLGVFGRSGGGDRGAGLGLTGQWLRQGPRDRYAMVRARVRGTVGDLPILLVDGDAWLGSERLDPLTIDLGLGARWSMAGRDIDEPVAGLPSPGNLATRGTLQLRLDLTRDLSLVARGMGELGFGARPYIRLQGLVGLTVHLGTRKLAPDWVREAGSVTLELQAPSDTREVSVAGSFSGWTPQPMTRTGDTWHIDLDLEPGEYEYVYLVDGVPLTPPEAALRRDDGFGGENGVLYVTEAR